MKKFAASLGLVALGTTALHAVEATVLNPMQRSKPWSVAASLRGFYDDNIDLSPNKVDSFGYEVSPSVNVGVAGEQTSFNLGYQLNAKYFETTPAFQEDKWSLTHIFEGALSHRFNPRASVTVNNSFVMGNEPDTLRAGNHPLAEFQPLVGNNNIVNYGAIDFDLEASELLGFNIGYNNSYFHYDDSGAAVFGPIVFPSTAGTLNRIENRFNVDSQWKVAPQTMAILGYMYRQDLYTGDEIIGFNPATGTYMMSDARNTRRHNIYVGAQHAFAPTLTGVLKAGATYNDYYGNPASENQWSPYVVANLNYQYRTTTVLDFGFSYSQSASDVLAFGSATPDNLVTDVGVALLYGTVSQTLLEHLIATGRTTLQYGTYNGGTVIDGENYLYFQLGLELTYQITPNFGAHVGYTFDDYSSDVQSDYNRNRVYIGVTAAY